MRPSDSAFVKSPFENVFNLLNVLPHGHEKALKQALYNALALFILGLCCAAAWCLFYILEPFVKPLIWALLVGSVLHPLKRSLERRFQSWLSCVEASSKPLLLAVIMIPINVIDKTSEQIGNTIQKYIVWLVGLCVIVFLIFLSYNYVPQGFFFLLLYMWEKDCEMVHWLLNSMTTMMFFTLMATYVGLLCLYWSPKQGCKFSIASYFIWNIVALYCARSLGVFAVSVFVLFETSLIIGFGYEVWHLRKQSGCSSYMTCITLALSGEPMKPVLAEENPAEEPVNDDVKESDTDVGSKPDQVDAKIESPTSHLRIAGIQGTSHLPRKSDPEVYFRNRIGTPGENTESGLRESSKYLYAVIWACGLVLIWKNVWVTHLLPLPIAIYVIKRIGYYFGIWTILNCQFETLKLATLEWIRIRESAIFPAPVRGIYKVGLKLRKNLLVAMRESISPFASTLVILALILFIFCFFTFLIIKIYAEGIHLITVGAGVINSTVVHNPEFLQLLPEGWNEKMESVLNNAYIYGREGISKQLRSVMKDVEPMKVAELEKHILEFWDRVYQAWLMSAMETPQIGPKVHSEAVLSSWQNFMEVLQRTPGVLNMNLVTEFLKENLETLLSLTESVWNLLKGNVSLVFHFLFAVVSVLLGGGSAVVNFFVSGIVFFTALFYLLSSSSDLYKPVDLLSNFSPVNGNKVGVAFEAAVNGVFNVSFKMAVFYGLWTWLIHNLFQVRIIYLPSVLAAILGAVPFLGTYWASIPAVLELWLAQEQGMLAVALLICQCLPMYFVDTAIYLEIRGGGHPYMTGLAIAGGVFCMGIQGAILGPLLLCCLLVALNMSSSLMKESPSEQILSMRQLRRVESDCNHLTVSLEKTDINE